MLPSLLTTSVYLVVPSFAVVIAALTSVAATSASSAASATFVAITSATSATSDRSTSITCSPMLATTQLPIATLTRLSSFRLVC